MIGLLIKKIFKNLFFIKPNWIIKKVPKTGNIVNLFGWFFKLLKKIREKIIKIIPMRTNNIFK